MFRKFLLVTSLFFVFLFTPKLAFAKDYTLPTADFVVQINPDGSANVTEIRTYNFDGSFTWADEWIYLKSSSISDISLTGGDLTQEVSPDKIYLKWTFSATNENKTFVIKYKIDRAVINNSDIAEFYWQLIGDQWTKGVGQVTAKVILPYPAPNDQIWAFGHGPLNGKVSIPTNQETDFTVSNLPANKLFEVRVLFPKNSSFINTQTGSSNLAGILAEEKKFSAGNSQKAIAEIVVAVLLSFLAIWRVIVWIRKFISLQENRLQRPLSNSAGGKL